MKNREIRVFEHGTLRIGSEENELRENEFESLCRFYENIDKRYFYLERRKIKFKHYVGVLQVGGLTIEVLPKVDKDQEDTDKWHDALVKMLKYTQKVRSYSTTDSSLSYSKQSLLDLYFEQFLHEVEVLFKEGLRKKYRHKEGNLNKLKGRIVFNEHVKRNSVHKNKLFCSYQTYDFDHDIHSALKMALLITKDVVRNSGLNAKAKRLELLLPEEIKSNISIKKLSRIHLDRTTKRYEKSLQLAELIIRSYCPTFTAGRMSVLAFMFDMNHLYEEFIYTMFCKISTSHIDMMVQRRKNKFWNNKEIKPDILIKLKTQSIVVDTKWKVPKNANPGDDDLKQIFVYNKFFNSAHSFLLYPMSSQSEELMSNAEEGFYTEKISLDGNMVDTSCTVKCIDFFNDEGFLDPQKIQKRLSHFLFDSQRSNNEL